MTEPGARLQDPADLPLEHILASSPSGAIVINAKGKIFYRNPKISSLLGLPPSNKAGFDFRGVFTRQEDLTLLQRSVESRESGEFEIPLRGFDGGLIWVVAHVEPIGIFDDTASLIWVYDISDRREIEEELRLSRTRLSLAIEGTGSAIWDSDLETGARWWSRQFYRMLGYNNPMLSDQKMWEAHLHPEDAPAVLEAVDAYLSREIDRYQATYRMLKRNGEVFWVEARGRASFRNGKAYRFNGIMVDITARKRAETELIAAKEKAEKALSDLRMAQQELVRSEKMAALGSLVAGVAHEINTPLGNALTATSHLADETAAFASKFREGDLRKSDLEQNLAMSAETTKLMMSNLQRAVELIQSFKRVAVDQTSGEYRVYDLCEYLHETLLSLRPALKKTLISVKVDCPKDVIVKGFPGAMSQIITNLVMNSVLHGFDAGDAGHITLSVAQLEGDKLRMTYCDDGNGMTKEVAAKAFDPFYTTKRKAGGSGLGLHIVYNLVTVGLGGSLKLNTAVGQGSCFEIEFPRESHAEEPLQ